MPKTYEELCEIAKVSPKAVYTYLGLSKQTWSSIMNYETQIKANYLLMFCDLVKCDPRDVLVKGYNC